MWPPRPEPIVHLLTTYGEIADALGYDLANDPWVQRTEPKTGCGETPRAT